MAFWNHDDTGKLLLRLSVGGLMLFHGVHKLIHGHDGIRTMLADAGLPPFMAYGVPVGEVLAPILILVGFWSRPAAVLVAFTMLMSIYLAFGWGAFALNKHGAPVIELNLLFLFGALALVFLGSGRYSLSRGDGVMD